MNRRAVNSLIPGLVHWLLFLCVTVGGSSEAAETGVWPQAAGPHGNWIVESDQGPTRWSVTRGENVVWRTPLPEGGQSTVVVWKDRLFVTINQPWPADVPGAKKPNGRNCLGYCLNSYTGKILWSVKLPGIRDMKYAGIFSDSTSPSPVTDGKHVWFFNASGYMGCWDYQGKKVWTRAWQPRQRHHSRQFEPYLVGDTILNVEVLDKVAARATAMHKELPADVEPKKLWTYLHGIDKRTGKVLWVAEAGTAIHNTPEFGSLADGTAAIFHGRGGGHQPPEKPYGWTLTSLAPGRVGKTLWSVDVPGAGSHYTSQWNGKIAVWMHGAEHFVADAASGKVLRKAQLETNVTLTSYSQAEKKYTTEQGASIKLSKRAGLSTRITNQANLLFGNHHYFLSWKKHLVGRVNVDNGQVEYLQVPVLVDRRGREEVVTWEKAPANDTRNSRGVDIGVVDKRSKGDGWGHVSAACPVAIGSRIYFPTMLGMVYVIDARAKRLDERSLLAINDCGPATETWSLSSLTFANGRIYHRSMKEVICLGTAFGR